MTYAELIKELQDLDPEQLNDNVTVYVRGLDEYYSVSEFQIAVGTAGNALNDGHAYLEI